MILLKRIMLTIAIIGLVTSNAMAQELDPKQLGQDALAKLPDNAWYDQQRDDIQPMKIPGETEMPSSLPGSEKPKAPPKAKNNWNFNFPDIGILGAILMYTLLFAVLALLVYLMVRAIRQGGPAGTTRRGKLDDPLEDTTTQVDRVENLPFDVKKKDANLLEEAKRCYEAGNYNEAIIYLFSFQLVELDKGHLIRLTKGKTNGQYLRETRQYQPIRDILRQTMNAFEDVFFGNHNLSADRFTACWQQIPEFKRLIEGSRPA